MSEGMKQAAVRGPVFGCLVGMPLLRIAAIFSIPYVVILGIVIRARERNLRKRLTRLGRVRDWVSIRPQLEAGSGTLIVEQANKEERRIWWTEESVAHSWQSEIPSFEVEYITHNRSHPMVAWIVERYLEGRNKTAFLVLDSPQRFWPPFGMVSDEFKALFPKARVVFTILTPKLAVG